MAKRMGDALTPAQEHVLFALRAAEVPMSAYEVLAVLRESQPTAAPPTAYRALNRLITLGLAHRLESLNAYVACAEPHHATSVVFTICDDCGDVVEHLDNSLEDEVAALSTSRDFEPTRPVLEVHGRCGDCRCAGESTA